MATVIKQTDGHYEVEEVTYGRVYAWCSDCVVVQCDCGEKLELTALEATCGCGTDHASLVQGELESRKRGGDDPQLKEEHDRWREEKDEYLRSEENYCQELEELE